MKKRSFVRKAGLLLVSAILLFSVTACGSKFMGEGDILSDVTATGVINLSYVLNEQQGGATVEKRYQVEIAYELYYDEAPITVTNFVSLVQSGFYNAPEGFDPFDTTAFPADDEKQTSALFVNSVSATDGIRLGDAYFEFVTDEPTADVPDPEPVDTLLYRSDLDGAYRIPGEFAENGWEVEDRQITAFTAGVMYMTQDTGAENPADSAYSEFGIVGDLASDTMIDNYAAFGRVTSVTVREVGGSSRTYTFGNWLDTITSANTSSRSINNISLMEITVSVNKDLGSPKTV